MTEGASGGMQAGHHLVLRDALAAQQPAAVTPLHEVASLLHLPAWPTYNPYQLWESWRDGEPQLFSRLGEGEVVTTYAVYLRFQLLHGQLTREEYEEECTTLRAGLKESGLSHLQEFAAAWKNN